MLEIRQLVVGPYAENCYILVCRDSKESAIVDPGDDAGKILSAAEDTRPQMIVITHGHIDHVGALQQVRSALRLAVLCHADDAADIPGPVDREVADGEDVVFGNVSLRVIHTPGHTPGSICLYRKGDLIAGDTIFPGGPGKTTSPAAFSQILATLQEKIFVLPGDTRVYPGHGTGTTIGAELPFFQAFLAAPKRPDLCGDVTWSTT